MQESIPKRTKCCTKCFIEKDFDDFHLRKEGRLSACKECIRAHDRERNRERYYELKDFRNSYKEDKSCAECRRFDVPLEFAHIDAEKKRRDRKGRTVRPSAILSKSAFEREVQL